MIHEEPWHEDANAFDREMEKRLRDQLPERHRLAIENLQRSTLAFASAASAFASAATHACETMRSAIAKLTPDRVRALRSLTHYRR